MLSARSGPGQKHAVKSCRGTSGVSRSPDRPAGCIILHCPFQPRERELRAYLKPPAAQALYSVCREPSAPRRCGRSCWPMRWRQPLPAGGPSARRARPGAYNPPAWPSGSPIRPRPRAANVDSGSLPWRCLPAVPCRRSSSAWHQPDPCRYVARRAEGMRIGDAGNQGGRD